MKPRKWAPGTGTQAKLNSISDVLLGVCCVICKSNKSLLVHRKDGTKHQNFSCMGLRKFETELLSGKYVRVCYGCHNGIHWVMKFCGWSWERIEEFAGVAERQTRVA